MSDKMDDAAETRDPDDSIQSLKGWGGDERSRGPMTAPPDASTFGVKIFLASLIMLFGATLLGYVVTRVQADTWTSFQVEGLRRSLVISTVLILLVSGALHFALHGIRYDHRDRLKFGVVVGTIFALLFLVNQFELWGSMLDRLKAQSDSVRVGDAKGGDLSVFLFFAMTVLHALHVLGGFIPLGIVIVKSFRNLYSGASFRGVWNCALYWHFIDGVWILMAIALSAG